ncbi:tol-pal system protein YbgF [Halopseudomonas laoshanensis]|uniref:tol-pal system protein YbgF n=1 Tax=Halopseudomonas laoshanensis TaxID=2268758 RepID=UPI00373657D8
MKGFRGFTTACLLLPFAAVAQVPVTDGSVGGARGNQSVSSAPGQAQAGLSMEGQLMQQLYQLQQEVSMLRGLVEEQEYKLKQMEQDQLDRYEDLDRRVSSGMNGGAPSNAQGPLDGPLPSASSNGTSAADGQSNSPAQNGAASTAEADPEREKLIYDAAFDLVKARDFDKAIQAFTAFVRRYPRSEYAGNAQYWLGEIHLVESDLESAGRAFALVVSEYPGHRKEADALYKLAEVERRLGNQDKAAALYREVLSKHPNSSAAQLARRDLDAQS